MNRQLEKCLHLGCSTIIGALLGSAFVPTLEFYQVKMDELALLVIVPPTMCALLAAVIWQLLVGWKIEDGVAVDAGRFSIRDLCFVAFVIGLIFAIARGVSSFIY